MHLGRRGVIPLHATVAMSAFHLHEALPRLEKTAPGVARILGLLMHSIFIFDNGDAFNTLHEALTMEYLLTLPTHFDQSSHYYAMLKQELTIRPILFEKVSVSEPRGTSPTLL